MLKLQGSSRALILCNVVSSASRHEGQCIQLRSMIVKHPVISELTSLCLSHQAWALLVNVNF